MKHITPETSNGDALSQAEAMGLREWLGALARHMMRILFRMLTNNRDYRLPNI